MRSPFRYPGGKTKSGIQEWILKHKPANDRHYREAFVGGGGVFFGLNPSQIDTAWLNDRHEGLIAVYEALRDRPEQFIAACREIEPARHDDPMTEAGVRGGEPKNARMKAVFDSLKLNADCDQALRYYYVNRTVHGSGRVNYDIPSRLYFSNPNGWNVTKGDHLERAARRVRGAKITNGDFSDVLEAPGENVWIYCDPPYVVNTNLTASSQLYQHSFTKEDHERFADAVKRCKHHVAVSYDADAGGFVRSLFPEDQFTIVETQWKYSGTTEAEKKDGRELLILNYQPPCEITLFTFPDERVLAPSESSLLQECEAAIEGAIQQGRDAFVEMGRRLKMIRDSGPPSKRLYRATHKTFEDYCRDRWNVSRPRAYQLIEQASRYAALKMSTTVDVLPATESQVRELARLESDEQVAEVWPQIVASVTNPKEITAAMIRKKVNEVTGYRPPIRPEPNHEDIARKALEKLPVDVRRALFEEFVLQRNAA